MFPKPKNLPSICQKVFRDAEISRYIGSKFCIPIFLSGSRPSVAFHASVPETSVKKDCKLLGREHQVGFAGQITLTGFPATDTFCSQNRAKPSFRRPSVVAVDGSHHS